MKLLAHNTAIACAIYFLLFRIVSASADHAGQEPPKDEEESPISLSADRYLTRQCADVAAERYVRITAAKGEALAVEGYEDDSNVVATLTRGENTFWVIRGDEIISSMNGYSLKIQGGNIQTGANVVTGDFDDTSWCFVDLGDGSYKIMSSLNGKTLTLDETSNADGERNVIMKDFVNRNQQWKIETYNPCADLPKGIDLRITSVATGKALAVRGYEDGSNAFATPTEGLNTFWQIREDQIISTMSGYNLKIQGRDIWNGANVVAGEFDDTSWCFEDLGDDCYKIISSLNRKALTVHETPNHEGEHNVIMYSFINNPRQKWKIEIDHRVIVNGPFHPVPYWPTPVPPRYAANELIPVGPDFPTPAPAPFPEISGPFFVFAVARFDNIHGGYFQRVFDFGNGPDSDNIVLTQLGESTELSFYIFTGSSYSIITAHGVIVQGVPLALRCGVDADATMWIEVDGKRVAEGPGRLPRNVARSNKLIGESNWPGDSQNIIGDVTNVQVVNVT